MKWMVKNPVSGDRVNALSPTAWVEGIGGFAWLLLLMAGGYYGYRKVASLTSGTPLGPMTTLPQRSSGVPVKMRVIHGL